MAHDKLCIAINAQLQPNSGAGGVESVLIGLISSLGKLDDGPEEYYIIAAWNHPDWLKPYMGRNQHIVTRPGPYRNTPLIKRFFSSLYSPLLSARKLSAAVIPSLNPGNWPEIPLSNGFYESLGCQVIHFPYQQYVLCSIPSVFNPHDLQHLHFPQFFTPQIIAWREAIYPKACHLAHTVVTGSSWVKQDIIEHYRVFPDKIQVIPWAPPTQAYQEPADEMLKNILSKYSLPEKFALYPAVTWEHKNHLRLIDGLAYLRDSENLVVHLVCTGDRHKRFWPRVKERLETLHMHDQVHFLDRIPSDDLRALYRLADFVIVPTLFEAASGPVFEAWEEGTPVACSNVTSLPEQVGNASLLFDPYSVTEITNAIRKMASDEALRSQLSENGKRRLKDFSWERTAKTYRAVYRKAARKELSEEDKWLLSWDWMKNPEK